MNAWEDLNPTRIAIMGDWHGNSFAAMRAIEYAADHHADAVIQVGDFGFQFEDRFMRNVQKTLRKARLPLGWVDGNHENHSTLNALVDGYGVTPIAMRPNIFYLPRTFRWKWSCIRFLALGGAHSVDRPWRTPGIEWWPDETISWQQAQQASDDGPCDVMITHDVPDGVRIPWIEGNPYGFPQAELDAAQAHREVLRQVVDQVTPRHLYAGHYHGRLTATLNGASYSTTVNILNDDSSPVAENTVIVELSSLGAP